MSVPILDLHATVLKLGGFEAADIDSRLMGPLSRGETNDPQDVVYLGPSS